MSSKTLIIHQNKILHNILKEISEIINFEIIYTENSEINSIKFENYIIISQKKILGVRNQLVVDEFPLRLNKLIEIINIAFLKKEYNFQSNINIGKYELNLNSRVLTFDRNNLDLTEMEANVILFLKYVFLFSLVTATHPPKILIES